MSFRRSEYGRSGDGYIGRDRFGRIGRNGSGAGSGRVGRTRSTFIIEALLILICLMIVLAVVMATFGFSWQQGVQNSRTQQAMSLAQNTAERFAADPYSVQAIQETDHYIVRCEMQPERQSAGEMVYATISVGFAEDQLFQLQTSRYIPDSSEDASETKGGDSE